MKRRIGRFKIKNDIVYSEDAQEIFKQLGFVPLRCESMYNDCFEYIGISPLFHEVIQGDIAPNYDIVIDCIDAHEITVSVKPI